MILPQQYVMAELKKKTLFLSVPEKLTLWRCQVFAEKHFILSIEHINAVLFSHFVRPLVIKGRAQGFCRLIGRQGSGASLSIQVTGPCHMKTLRHNWLVR